MDAQLIDATPPVIRVCGEVDYSNVADLRALVDEALQRAPAGFVIDLASTQYIDSAGIAAVISAYQRLRASEGKLAIVLGNENVRKILDLIRIDMLPGVSLHDNLETAKAAAVCVE